MNQARLEAEQANADQRDISEYGKEICNAFNHPTGEELKKNQKALSCYYQ